MSEFQHAVEDAVDAVIPGVEAIGAAIRTVLNYFLAQEIERAERMEKEGLLMAPDEMPGPKRQGAEI